MSKTIHLILGLGWKTGFWANEFWAVYHFPLFPIFGFSKTNNKESWLKKSKFQVLISIASTKRWSIQNSKCQKSWLHLETICKGLIMSGGELLKIWLLDNHLLDTFGRKSTARHKIYQLLESSKSWLNWIRADDNNIVNCSNPVFNCCLPFFLINYFT